MLLTLLSAAILVVAIMLISHAMAVSLGRIWPSVGQLEDDRGWTIAAGAVIALTIIVNLNLWLPARTIWLGLIPIAAVSGGVASRLQHRSMRWPMLLLVAGAAASVAIAMLGWMWLFDARQYWMREGTNHDMVYFFGGASWATSHALGVSQQVVASEWNLGNCGQGGVMVGHGCSVYRGGTYSLLSLGSLLSVNAGPNLVRAAVGVLGLLPVIGLLPVQGRRLFERAPRKAAALAFLALFVLAAMVSGSPGLSGAIVNENIGTAFGAAVLAMMMAWVSTPCSSPGLKAATLGISAGLAGHVYGEAAAYACWIAAMGVIADAYRLRRPIWVVTGGIIAFTALTLSINVVGPDLIASYIEVSGLVASGQWLSWFISAPPYAWLAAPFTGVLMGGNPAVTEWGLAVGLFLGLVTLVGGWRRSERVATIGLVVLSALLVFMIEKTGYQYGEHKIVQLLGPAWVMHLAAMTYRSWDNPRAVSSRAHTGMLYLGALSLALSLVLSLHYVYRAHNVVGGNPALSHAFDGPFLDIRPGDEVVIDVSAVADAERYISQDLATLMVHMGKGRVLLSDKPDDSMIGYTQAVRSDQFRRAGTPDWLIQLRTGPLRSIFKVRSNVSKVATDNYDIFDLANGGEPVALAGGGWHRCTGSQCWTQPSYRIEVYMPASCRSASGKSGGQLLVEQEFFLPPQDGTVIVKVDGQRERTLTVGVAKQLRVPVSAGWSVVTVSAGWNVISPKQAGQSEDGRSLFASLSHIEPACN